MKLDRLQDWYKRSPLWLKQWTGRAAAWVPMGRLLGPAYRDTRAFLRESESWTSEQHLDWQVQSLRSLLLHCERHVPYYRRLFADCGLRADRFEDPADLERLPVLTKSIIRAHETELRAETYPDGATVPVTTGGSTGEPLRFQFDKAVTRQAEKAYIHDHWSRVGYRPGDRVAALRGAMLPPDQVASFDPLLNMLLLSPFQLNAERVDAYRRRIEHFRPDFLWVYPSTAVQFATELARQQRRLDVPLKAVICASEKVFPYQRRLLEQTFDCRVFSYYGLSEYCVCGAECEESERIHLYPQYGWTELLASDGYDAPEGAREIVATGFNNRAFPFLRYRTGDLAVPGNDPCSCGRAYPMIDDIIGRGADFVVTRSGKLVSLTSLIFGQHFGAFAHMRKMQLEQATVGRVVVRIVRTDAFTGADEDEIQRVMLDCAGAGELDLDFDYVEDIASTRLGKHPFLKQSLDLSQLDATR